jgi:hypothetical protein
VPYWVLGYGVACCILVGIVWRVRPVSFMEVPAIGLLLFAVSATVALSCAGQWYIHQRFLGHDFLAHNEVGGFIIGIIGSVYAVMLGFLTVVGWQHFAEARGLVALESAAAADVWHAATGLPAKKRARVRSDALRYASLMTRSEWPKMRAGSFDPDADFIVMDAMMTATFIPPNAMESNSQNATLQELNVLHDVRQRRLADNASGMSGFEWLVLAIGAVSVVCICWIFGIQNASIHLFMTATVTLIITSMLVLLFELQYPFRTDLRITPISWSATIDHIHLMQDGSQMRMRM